MVRVAWENVSSLQYTYYAGQFGGTDVDLQAFNTDGITPICETYDYGDAPASYGEVSHKILSSIYLGDNPPDAETASKYSFNARADNYDDGAPQQAASGVYIPLFPVLQLTDSSYSVNFKVTNLTGTAGKLHGWIDFDKSGTFEADEAAVVDVPSGASNATATLNWGSIPLDIQLGTVALRLRLSTDASVLVSTPTGSANDGEVEDYPIAIAMDIPPNSPSLAIVNGATPAACEVVVFQDNFNDLTPGLFWGLNRPGSQAVRDWDRSGGGNDTYAHITASSATDRSIYFGNGGVRQISPSIGTGFSFDANGKLLTVIDAIALRDDMDDIISPGTTVNEYGSKADWGPEPVKFSRSFSTIAGKTYRLYFKAKPEDPAGTYESGIMRLDMPGGSLHFKAPGSAEGVQSYAVEFTATSTSSVISFINYGHVENDNNKYCDPNSVFGNNVWCTVGGRTDGKVANELIIDDVVLTEAACATGSIKGRVYLDSNQDNNYDEGVENGLSAITVRLYDENGTTGDYSDDRLVNTKSTYVNGEYDFTEVNTSRSYRLEVDTTDSDLPAHTVIGTANPLTNRTVAANTLLDHQHFGFDLMMPSKILGTVYLDNNTNDSFNLGIDYGLGNITVSLHTMAGVLVASTQTAINGTYQFANLDHNLSYRITVDGTDADLPPGATLGTVNPIPNISVPQNSMVTKDVGFDQAANGITGKVFLDYNLNGQLDSQSAMINFANNMNIGLAFDKGIANAQIKAECVGAAGKLSFGPVTSDVNGQYYLATPGAVAGNYNCILQLTTIPSGYTVATQSGSGQQVLTQVVSPTAVNTYFALQQEMSYCQNNPDLAVNRFAYGQQTANAPFAGNNDVANIFAFPYNSGTAGVPNTLPLGYNHPLETDTAFKDLALANQVGSVFGLGWHPSSHSLFASAYMKAWTGFGSGGTGGIYRVDLSNPSSPVSSLYANLNQIFPATPPTVGSDPYLTGIFSSTNPGYVQIADGSSAPDGSYVASGNATRDNQNGQIAAAVGKTAFGDLDVSADGKSLFVVNMANNKLYILPVRSAPLTAADAGLISSYSIPFAANCRVNGTKRAFGLGEYEEGLYVATECGAEYGLPWEVSEHSVFRFDLQSKTFSTTPSLVYASSSEDSYGISFSLITDLVFDPAGQMILTFRNNLSSSTDTTADDGKGSAYSVIRRACIQDKAAYRWEKENNASCGGVTTPGKDAGYGTGPGSGTFFYQEYPADNGPALRSASYGGAAQIPGFMEMAYTVSEPFEFYSVGVSWVDTGLGNPATAGQRNRAYSFYKGTGAFDYPDNRPVNGKNAAIGDLEVLCDTPSLEIGNRVWQDSDSDGVQDAGELPVAGVKVELFANGANLASATPLATTVTDANGYYVFSSDMRGYPATGNNAPNDTTGANGGFNAADIQGGRASTTSHKYGLLSLTPNTQYQVVIRNVGGASKQASLGSMTLSTVAQGTDPELDSDAGAVGNHAVANVSMLGYGNHYHAVDFGFKVGAILTDYGDAPASYGTPSHTIVSGIRLGATAPDGETAAQPSIGANLDDTTGTDDEDGITLPALTQGQTTTITTTVVGAGGYLQGWIDWNGDGDFADSGEQVATNIQDNLVGDTNNVLGTIAFSVAVPANAVTTPTYARFRWSTTISLDAITAAVNGEVEDYALTITNPSGQSSLSGKVWFDSNNDGIQNDGTTAYIGGAKVELYNPATSTIVTTTTTDANGNYQFSSAAGFLPSTTYQLRIRRLDTQKPFSEWSLTTANLGGDDNLDSDAILNGNYWIISFTSPNSGNSATGYGFGFVTNSAQGCIDVGSTGIANDTLSNGHAHAYDFVFAGKQVTGFCAEPSEPSPQLNDSYQVYSSDRLGFSTAQKSKLRRLYSAIQDPDVLFSIARVSPPGGSQAFNQQMLLDHVMSYMSWYYLHYNENMTTIISTFFESNGDYTAEQLTLIRDLLPLIADRVAGTNGQVQYPEQNMFWLWNMTTTTRQDIIIPSSYAAEASCAANTNLSGKVWFDSNNDGIQNDGVGAGVEGAKLELFNPATNTIVATTTTTATGTYAFDTTSGLMPNISYQVRMLKPDNDFPLSDWGLTAKNMGGDPNQDSDAVVNGSYWQINLVSPNSGQTLGGYDIGLVNTIPQGCLDNGATGVAYVAPSPFYAYNFLFNGKQVSGYCLEVADFSPQANDSFQVNPIDRRGLSAIQRSQLARLYSALHDPDIVFPIISVSNPNTMQDNLDALLKYMTWYYSDYNENITSVNNNITDNNSLTVAQKDLYKILAVKIINRVAGSNGETQYPEQKLYWLWNLTTTARQDIVVPARYIIGGVCTANYVISGKVFEDVNYGGGAGRNASVTGTAGISGTQVELYNSTGNFVSNTTTAANGAYSFSAVPAGNYFVRVVNASVNSSRSGSNGSELGVQTFRTNGTVAITNEVGGRKPDATDAEAHDGTATLNTTTFVFSGGALNGKQAQSVTPVTVAGALSGVDFGFNFDTVVNTNDSGQGSLRQFILNANLLGGEASLAQVGLAAGKERSIFMLPLTDPRYINSDGVANNGDEFWRIPLLNGLPETTGAETVLDASTQAGSQCNPVVGRRLVVELDGSNVSNLTGTAITLAGPYNGVRGFAIGSNSGNQFTFGIYLRKRTVFESQTPAHDSVIACNNIGATPSGQAYPVRFYTDAVGIFADNVTVGGSDPADRNIIGSADDDGVESEGNATIIRNNYIGLAADGVSKLPLNDHVVALWPPGSNMTVIDNKLAVTRFGIFSQSSGTTVRNNTIGLTANGQNVVAGGEYLLQFQAGNALAENNLFASGGAGGQPAVILMDGSTFQNNTIGFNSAGISVAGSGSAHVGISLRNAAGTANTPIVINNNTIGNAGSAGIGFNSDVDVPVSITRNRIGVAPNGITPASNAWSGIAVNNNASSPVTIGGANLGNIIANNMKAAIAHTGTGIVTVNQNSIYNNTGLGIDLSDDAVTTNDAGDVDVGPNGKLNFPLLQQLVFTNGNLIVRGCAPAGSVVELFEADVSQGGTAAVGANRFGHLFDYGEGQSYLGSFVEGTVVDADTGSCAIPAADGNNNTGMKAFQFSIPVPASVVSGDYLTATATLAAMGTSEFSPTVAVIDGPPPVGSGSCAATGGSDILFIVDNSGSIVEPEYADFAQTIQAVGSQVLVSNPKNRIAVAHFGGPSDSLVSGGQYVYIERDFSSTAMLAPVRQFGWGGSYNPTWTADHLAGALQQMRYALDGQASTTSSYILSPLKETSRNTASPLQIVLMTDATRYLDLVPNDISMLIDPPGSGAEPDDGSAFTIYNQMKAEGVLFSVASFNADPSDIAASAAIASVGGTYTGDIEANAHDPQGSQVTPRRYVSVTAGFQLTTTQLEELVEGTAICGSSIQGRVFEDPNYGGGTGRPFGTLGTVGITGASIEVYDQAGNYVASVVSTTDGKYSLPNLPDAPYYVRVVDATVKSSRLGSNGSEIPVLTYRTDGLVATANQIGGNKPMLADAGVNLGTATLNTTTFLFSGGGLTGKPAQSVQLVNLSGGDLKGVDFGFNFSTVVNTNDSGQGSLRQFLLNNKQLATDGLAQVLPASLAAEYPAGTETSIFMIPATQLTAGQAIITLTSGALSLERMHTAIDGRTQIANIGSGTIVLNNSISNGLNLLASATSSAVRDITVSHAAGSGVLLDDTDNAVLERVTILNNSQYGVSLTNEALNNRIVTNTIAHNAWAGIAHIGSGLGNTYSQNSIHDNGGLGIDLGVDGVTANDDLDVDTGSNKLLNYPVVEAGSSISSNGTKVVAYDFDLDVPTNTHGYRLEFFRNTAVDSSSHGEGEIYLGYVDINHAGGGLLNFKGSLNANQTVPANANIAVTLTEKTSPTSLGSTSEFSGVKNGSVSICTDLINGTGADITVNENAPVITYLESTDDNGNPITYVISGGADSNQFIVQGPEPGATLDCQLIVFYKPNVMGARSSALIKALPLIKPGDYEAPTDNGGDNTYNLTITATVNGQAYERPVTVGVNDINEAPEIINETQTEFLEGKTGVALDLESFDPDAGDAEGAGISYALSGGVDRARFKLNPQTGELSFIATPDFEQPVDASNDNIYDIDLRVMDDQGLSSVSSLKIAVTDDKLNDGVYLQTKVLLQGPYIASSGLMQDSLRTTGILPISQPYQASPFNYLGTEQLNLDLATVTGKEAVVDWVLIELRDAANPKTIVASKAALVQRDGDVIDALTGSAVLNFPVATGSYLVSVRHRNHLGVRTATAVSFGSQSVMIDFSQTATKVAGIHARLEATNLALLWAGDANNDELLIATGIGSDAREILNVILKTPSNINLNSSYRLLGYLDSDLNMDGATLFMGPSNDANVLLGNLFLFPSNTGHNSNYIVVGGLAK
ncbi:SdrD B-like domain-containing protein [uncultured Thiothrix sp.]|uniref:SdrD B-like domain-containing protein n=1 Tax=uncultured Thiothrix sp. TaxID=223185 RepID=UPI002605C7F1|nr:SdrD B-like domain-containing protein [uncultured Thiothrix sp.]HMT93856.1 SdrD B-like domain-containing protein [Thiolinea sp.]